MHPAERRTYSYAGYLTLGTLFVTPVAGLALDRLGVPLTPALLGVLALVFAAYGFAILRTGDVRPGLLVSVLVLMTVGANIPLGQLPQGVTVGPNLYVVDLPLLVLFAVTLSSWRREHFTAAHSLLALYLVWSFLLVAVAPGPRPDVMLWYAVHVARYVLVFAVVTRGILDDWLTGHEALGTVVLAVTGHAGVASVQAITGPVEGLTVLGMNTRIVAEFPLGPFGSLPTGPYVGGFTGGAPFAVLLSILIPVVLGTAFVAGVPRLIAVGGVVWLAFLLQLTAWDAARGALLVSLMLSFLIFGWWKTGILRARIERFLAVTRGSWLAGRWPRLVGFGIAVATLGQLIQWRGRHSYGPAYLDPELGQAFAQSVEIPGFSTQNLAIRLYQYVGGIDVFLQTPLTGLGGANFYYTASNYAPTAHMIHNLFVGILAETGFVGALLFFGALGYVILTVWRLADRDDDPIFYGLLAGIGGMLALQFFQPQYLRAMSFVPVWAIFGIACGHYRLHRNLPNDDLWMRTWHESRMWTALSTAQVSQSLDVLPHRIRAGLHGSFIFSPIVAVSSQWFRIVSSSRVISAGIRVTRSSAIAMAWHRFRNYCANSYLCS